MPVDLAMAAEDRMNAVRLADEVHRLRARITHARHYLLLVDTDVHDAETVRADALALLDPSKT